jgi:hypothetical protein
MTTNLTASIAGVIYPVKNTSVALGNKVDQRSTLNLTIFDANNTYAFQFGQPVVITDTLEGIKFTGFIQKPVESKIAAQNAKWITLSCMDNRFLADVMTSNIVVAQQYAGIVAAKMVSDNLGPRGISANYALRLDTTQSDFMAGTLNNTVATANNGGDLELALAGVDYIRTGIAGTIQQANGLKFTGYCASGYSLAYVYRQIWTGSITIANNDYLTFDMWVSSDSPSIKAGVDFICSDGTTLRDSGNTDNQGMSIHPSGADLSGLANDQWYSRTTFLTGSLVGKTISSIMVAIGGANAGTYTVYFRRIAYNPSGGGSTTIFGNASTLSTNVQVLNNGYTNVSLTQVSLSDKNLTVIPATFDIHTVGIVRKSAMTWSSVTPTGCTAIRETSIDSQASWQQITSGAAVPNLLAGMSAAGMNVSYRDILTVGKDPTVIVSNSAPSFAVYSAYNAAKSDVSAIYTTSTQFATGTLTDVKANGATAITTNGYHWSWANGFPSQSFFGSGSSSLINKQQYINCNATSDARLRMDFAGTWQNFVAEIDITAVASPNSTGFVYRTTNWGNSNDSYAYAVSISTGTVLLAKGSNSTGAGAFTSLTSASVFLTANSIHRLKIVVNGTSHSVYLDGVLYINNFTDATYTAAGYIGLRTYNGTGSAISTAYNNFGVCSALSGTWQSPSIDISGPGTYGNSVLAWDSDGLPDSTCLISAQTSINGGSSWQTATNGGAISGLTAGGSLSGVHLLIKMFLTASNADVVPVLNGVSVWIMGQYSATGTRICPLLYLTLAGRAGSTLASYNAIQPTNTSVTLATSLDGIAYTNVANQGQIAGISAQPLATLDTFNSNSSPNYTSTNRTGGSVGIWIQDTINSLMTVSGGTNAQLLYAAISCKDADIVLDLDQADCVGLVWRVQDASNFYELDIFDASSNAGATNALKLYKVVANTKTQLGSTATVTLTRNTKYRVRVVMIGTAITVSIDGVSKISLTDSALAGPGKIGISEVSGVGRFYNFRVQPLGDDLTGKKAYGKLTLTSTDPTATPQITGFTLAALNPSIGLGALIDTVSYQSTYISANLDDMAKRSNSYYWTIDQNLSFIFNDRVATPAPYILQSSDQLLLLNGPPTVAREGALYRNRHTVIGVLDANGNPTQTISINNTNLANTITQKQFAAIMGRSTAVQVVLNLPSGAVTASGDVGDLDVSKCAQIAVDINISAISGTTPTIQFFVDRKDANGLYFNLWQSNVVSATGQASASIGPFMTMAQSLGSTVKLRYTITGTTPSATFSVSVLGRLTVQSAGLGIVEVVEDVSSLKMSIAGATAYCTAQLQRYGTIGRTLTFKTRRSNPSLAIGQYLPVFIPEHGLNDASMLITQVDTSQKIVADPSGNPTQQYTQSVTVTENANTQNVWKLLASTLN